MRISTGVTVNVSANTERWLASLRAQGCFLGSAFLAASVGNFSHVQLFNPAASGKTLLLRGLVGGSPSATQISINSYNTALTTLFGAGLNGLMGGAAGVAELRTQTNAAELGTTFGRFRVLAGDSRSLSAEWIAEIPEGKGVLLSGGAVNIHVDASFTWEEV